MIFSKHWKSNCLNAVWHIFYRYQSTQNRAHSHYGEQYGGFLKSEKQNYRMTPQSYYWACTPRKTVHRDMCTPRKA